MGARIEPMPTPHREDPEPAVETYIRARMLAEIRALPAEKQGLVLPEVAAWASRAEGLSASALLAAAEGIDRMRRRVVEATGAFDYVLSPVMPMTAFAAETAFPDPARGWSHLHFTFPYNQTQQPAISLNCGFDGAGLPIGLQIIGRRFDDAGVLALAAAYEAARPPMRWPEPATADA
jgi:Asp-tRNA(Asn)/Glu-tRNA(Gln) amidotransferase A subunit family amidase